MREGKSEKEGRMKKKERHRRRFGAKCMLVLTAVFLGSSMVQMFKSRAEGKRGLCKSGKGRSA